MCTSFLDGLDRYAPHVEQRVALAVVAKSPIERIRQIPACDVFTRTDGGIHHFWTGELLDAPARGHPRHVDLLWPIWAFFDLTPEGREGWMPKRAYD